MRDQFHSDRRIAAVSAPLLVTHGDNDPAISISLGERLLALAHEPRQFVRFAGGGHDNLDDFGVIQTARRFIDAAKADGFRGLAHSSCPDFEDEVT